MRLCGSADFQNLRRDLVTVEPSIVVEFADLFQFFACKVLFGVDLALQFSGFNSIGGFIADVLSEVAQFIK